MGPSPLANRLRSRIAWRCWAFPAGHDRHDAAAESRSLLSATTRDVIREIIAKVPR
jgi:hypothetical protein